jgi:hypothetical protein
MYVVTPQTETAPQERGQTLGLVTKITGSEVVVTGQIDGASNAIVGIGGLVKVSGYRDVIGIINSMELEGMSGIARVLPIRLVGEVAPTIRGPIFTRGVSRYPALGAMVTTVTNADLLAVYARPPVPNVRVGRLGTNDLQPAYVMTDELLSKHFAILGSTGCGKSCAVTLILSEMLATQPNAHVILLDPHNEYATAFGDSAEVVNLQSSHLPLWVLNHEEAVRILVRGGTPQEQEAQAIILKDAVREARQFFAAPEATGWITVDTPVPYATHELRCILRDRMGQVNKSDTARPYLQLESRIASLVEDKRFSFLFDDDFGVDDNLAEIVGRLLRIPVSGRPITIVDLSGLPSEISDVIVSVISRVLFDFTLWSDPEDRLPVLLACEEAHRYLPANGETTFAACTRAISRIAREGRKYGLSLALISQRPSELAPEVLSQCGTIFALRMGNDHDQHFVEGALPDTGQMMLGTLPNLPAGEAIVFGEAVSLPMHVRFDELEPKRRPRSQSAQFSLAWQKDSHGESFLAESIRRWRTRTD